MNIPQITVKLTKTEIYEIKRIITWYTDALSHDLATTKRGCEEQDAIECLAGASLEKDIEDALNLYAIIEEQTKPKKTNKQWYFYEEQSAYFRLTNGELFMCSEGDDDMPDENDMHRITKEEWYDDEHMTRDQMIKDLEGKE